MASVEQSSSEPEKLEGVDGLGRMFGNVSLAHQTCLALELVLLDTLHGIQPMAAMGHSRTPSNSTATDADNPQSMVIVSLRSQVSDLVSQVTQLNSKLVQSYDRISDLEDNIHVNSSNLRNSTLKISQLELERTQHLSALNTGLLVEKSHVTTELTRLMEKATDEAARRGKAESARQEIEKDLDDLSAELFDRANTMVAEARLAQAKSERRMQDAEAMLKGAEEAVASMQSQMQTLREEKDRTDRELDKGKWVERERPSLSPAPLKLLSTHVPYQEFLLFVAHLRQIRPVTSQPPPMATFLPLPFLARLVSEDSDPTLRLDSAPSLTWLTRRSVTSAIIQSQLIVEPLSISVLLELFAPPAYSGSQQQSTIVPCALCGKSVLPNSHTTPTYFPGSTALNGVPSSWRPAFFARQSSGGTPTKQNNSVIHSPTPSVATTSSFYPPSATSTRLSPPLTPPLPSPVSTVHVFRLLPASSQPSQIAPTTVYPLCTTGWCLARLRTTCELWRFVRSNIVDKVWEEEYSTIGLGPASQHSTTQNGSAVSASTGKPPVPPRRRLPTSVNVSMGKLLGMASSALGKASVMPQKQNGSGTPPLVLSKSLLPPPIPRRSDSRSEKGDDPKRRSTTESIQENKTNLSTMSNPVREDAKDAKPVGPTLTPENGTTTLPTESQDDVTTPRRISFHHTQGVHNSASGITHSNPELETRSITDPAAIPLPVSPVVTNEDFERQSQKQTSVPPTETATAASTSPVPPVDTTSPESSEEPIARMTSPIAEMPALTASPAPPPLPRRAPRRNAPVPPSEIQSPNTNTGSGEYPEPVKLDATKSSIIMEPASQGEFDISKTQEMVEASGTPPALQPEDANPSAVPKTPLADGNEILTSPPSPSPPAYSSRAREPSRQVPPPPSRTSTDHQRCASSFSDRRESSPHRSSISNANASVSGDDLEVYIGDATWEERTWKVLVRLREDMFYARLGSVR